MQGVAGFQVGEGLVQVKVEHPLNRVLLARLEGGHGAVLHAVHHRHVGGQAVEGAVQLPGAAVKGIVQMHGIAAQGLDGQVIEEKERSAHHHGAYVRQPLQANDHRINQHSRQHGQHSAKHHPPLLLLLADIRQILFRIHGNASSSFVRSFVCFMMTQSARNVKRPGRAHPRLSGRKALRFKGCGKV